MKTKRLLAVFLALMMVFAIAAPAALAAEIIPITSDQSVIIAMVTTSTATIRPVNPATIGYNNITYSVDSASSTAYGTVTNDRGTVAYGGINYPNIPIGTVTGLTSGNLVIVAKIGDLEVGRTSVTVRSVLGSGSTTISAGSTLLTYGQSTQLTSSKGYPITACSSNWPADFTVTNTGLVTCMIPVGKVGYADITAYDSAGNVGTIRLFGGSFPNNTVSAPKSNININESLQLFLNGYPDHCGSSNPAVATVTDGGMVKGVSNGTATIYCINSVSGTIGQFTVTVGIGGLPGGTGQVSLLKNSIAVGETTIINGAGMTIVTSFSSNSTVASTNGITVTGVSAGTTTITYVTNTGATGQLPITVTAGSSGTTDPNLPKPTKSYSVSAGGYKTFKYSNTSVKEAWSANPSVVSASLVTGSDGYKQARFTGLSAGTTTVYMKTASGSVSAMTIVVSAGDVTGRTGKISSGDDDLRVSVRKGAGSNYGRRATLSNGTKVTIKGESGVYYEITFVSSGKTYSGYVKKAFIAFN